MNSIPMPAQATPGGSGGGERKSTLTNTRCGRHVTATRCNRSAALGADAVPQVPVEIVIGSDRADARGRAKSANGAASCPG